MSELIKGVHSPPCMQAHHLHLLSIPVGPSMSKNSLQNYSNFHSLVPLHYETVTFTTPNISVMRATKPYTANFYLQNGVEILDFAGPLEVFNYAGIKVNIISKTLAPIKSQDTLTIMPDYSLQNAPKADILALFGGHSEVVREDEAVLLWIRSQSEMVSYVFTVCTGALMLAKAGLLEGLTATTFHMELDTLVKEAPNTRVLPNTRFVDNGKVITTAGVSAGIDGALHLVQKLYGEAKTAEVVKYMEYENWQPNRGKIIS